MATQVTDGEFSHQVLADPGLVLVDFWAPWCGPCRILGPVVDQIAQEYGDRVKVVKLNVDENPRTAGQYRIMGIPTMLLFQNGQVVDQLVGIRPKAQIAATLDRWLLAA
jgi:thioredoxin 1